MKEKSNIAGYVSAAVLAGITLVLFGRLQDVGPQSALRKLHQAFAENDAQLANSVVAEGIDSPYMKNMLPFLIPLLKNSNGYELVDAKRPRAFFVMAVEYRTRSGNVPFLWFLQDKGGVWKVNAQATDEAFERALHWSR